MIKFDVVLFLLGIGAIVLGAAVIETGIGALLFGFGCLAVIGAVCLTAARRLGDGDQDR